MFIALFRPYCTILINSAIMRHKACGHGQNWSLVLCHRLIGQHKNSDRYLQSIHRAQVPCIVAKKFAVVPSHPALGQCQIFIHLVTGHPLAKLIEIVQYV